MTLALSVAGCATPAVQVKVPTMSVQDAWNAGLRADYSGIEARLASSAQPSQIPIPVVSAPDIRMVYVKPWKDELGARHFGSWVALQVAAPRWVLPDGRLDAIESVALPRFAARPASQAAAAATPTTTSTLSAPTGSPTP